MNNQPDPIGDHMIATGFQNIADPIERVRFFRANKAAIGREAARRAAGTPLPAPPSINAKAEPFPRGLTVRRNGVVMRHIPSRGLFGPASHP